MSGALGGVATGLLGFISFKVVLAIGAPSLFGGIGSAISSWTESIFNDESVDVGDLLFDTVLGGLFGGLGGKLSKLMKGSFTEMGKTLAESFFDWTFGHVEFSISKIKEILFPKKSYAR